VASFPATANRRWAYATNGFRSLDPPTLPTQIPDEPYFYDERDPAQLLAGMDAAIKKLK
jgi:hypothetical protein